MPSPSFPNDSFRSKAIPHLLRDGVPMIKLTKKKVKQSVFRFESDGSAICWQSKKIGRISIDQIKEVRHGPSAIPTFHASTSLPFNPTSLFITIVYTIPQTITAPSSWKTLHVIAPSEFIFRAWIDTLAGLLEGIKTVKRVDGVLGITGSKDGTFANGLGSFGADAGEIASVMDDKEGLLPIRSTLEDVIATCRRLGLSPKASTGPDVHQIFKCQDTGGKGYLDAGEYKNLLRRIHKRKDLKGVLGDLAGRNGTEGMGREEFRDLVWNVQKNQFSYEEVDQIYDSLLSRQVDLSNNTSPPDSNLSLATFQSFLLSPENSLLAQKHREVCQDMTRPLSDYYIMSSHNTYLLGNQWRGGSSVEGYIRALLAGCRSVEIDCWDGDLEPVVYHGKTLTTPVPLRHVCEAINKYAFMASEYPLIISAEVHCNAKSQMMLVQVLKETFGSALVEGPLEEFELGDELPSPEQLKGRVLIKSKRPSQEAHRDSLSLEGGPFVSSSTESTESDFDQHSSRLSHSPATFFDRVTAKVSSMTIGPSPPISPTTSIAVTSSMHHPASARTVPVRSVSIDSISNSAPSRRTSTPPGKRSVEIIEPLAALFVYTAGVKFQGFTKLVHYELQDMFSVSERTANRILRANALDFVKHNRTHLSRVYPNGTRLTSSNFQPQKFWAAGSQLVALNIQTADAGYQINSAFFGRNGRAGYILRPDALTQRALQATLKPMSHRLKLKVISGQSLATPPDISLDETRLYVEASLHLPDVHFGEDELDIVSPDRSISSPSKWRTPTITGNTFNPIWDHQQTINFKAPPGLLDLCFLRVEVRHQPSVGDDVTIAGHIAGLGSLEQGYRVMPLFDRQMSQFLFSTLFVKVEIQEG